MKSTSAEKPAWVRKDLPEAIDIYFEECCPELGGDPTREPVVKRIMDLVDKYLPRMF